MNLIRALRKRVPKDVVSITLEVNSVPSWLDDQRIKAGWVDNGVLYSGRTQKGQDFSGHVRPGWFVSYHSMLREATLACAYFSARGVKTALIDSDIEGKYHSAFGRDD